MRRTRIGLATRAGLVTLAAVAPLAVAGATPAAAAPRCVRAYDVSSNGSQTFGDGEWICTDSSNPTDGQPLPVTLQQQSGDTWVTVATGTGTAIYTCTTTSSTNWRISQNSSVVRTFACG